MDRQRAAAIEALQLAARVCRNVQQDLIPHAPVEKPDRSPVTVADFASQAVVCRHLARAFPGDAIVGEESAQLLRSASGRTTLEHVVSHVRSVAGTASADDVLDWIDLGNSSPTDRFWTLDPIDGTKGFLRREQYAIALALIENGRVVLGALACPELPVDAGFPQVRGILCHARRGQGACLRPLDGDATDQPMRTGATVDLGEARFVESVESGHAHHEAHQQIATRLGIHAAPLRLDSQAKYAAVARGDASIYLRLPSPRTPDYRECIWDHAAGACVVEEAGGTVTDATGQPLDFGCGAKLERNRGVVATSGPIHTTVIDACLEALSRA